jgi:hypothetical protein
MLAGLLLGVALSSIAVSSPAVAHGGDETQEGYLLVQQSLGYLAHDTSHDGIDLAMEKVDDALAAKDHDGVSIAEVAQGKAALEAGDVVKARALLQDSIKAALSELPAATGNQTGTTLVVPDLPGRAGLTGQDWLLLVVSAVLVAAGAALAYRFRPVDSVATLRSRLGGPNSQDGASGAEPVTAHGSS